MDTLTKQSQGMTKPLGMTGPIQGIDNLPTNFGGAKPMDAMSILGLGRGLDPAMNRTPMDPYAMGPMGPLSDPYNTKSSYMPPGTNFNPMSSAQDARDVAADKEKAKIAEVERRKLLSERLDAESKKSQGLLYQGLDFSPIKVRGGSRGR